jgi:hypothetical protein
LSIGAERASEKTRSEEGTKAFDFHIRDSRGDGTLALPAVQNDRFPQRFIRIE